MRAYILTIFILPAWFVAVSQYYEQVGGLFNQYTVYNLNATDGFYTDSVNHKLYFIGVHSKSLTDSLSATVIEYDNSTDSTSVILQLPTTYSDIGAMAIFNNNMYIGGDMTYTSDYNYWVYLVYGNGQTWDTVPEQPNSHVASLLTWNNQLYVGGDFTAIGGVPYNRVAAYDGQNWHALAQGNCFYNGTDIQAMTYYNNYLYAAGTINDSCNAQINQLARWDGAKWEGVPGWNIGINSMLYALCVYNNVLYVAGDFFASDGVSLGNCIVGFDGQNWFSPGAGANNEINSMCIMDGKLYASGIFSWIDGVNTNCIAAWDGHQWCSIDSAQVQIDGNTICGSVDNKLALAGGFSYIGGKPFHEQAFWTGVNYTDSCGPLYTSIDNTLPPVNELEIYPNPAAQYINIVPQVDATGNFTLQMYDALGRVVYSASGLNTANTITVNVANLADGFYAINLFNQQETLRGKLIISR